MIRLVSALIIQLLLSTILRASWSNLSHLWWWPKHSQWIIKIGSFPWEWFPQPRIVQQKWLFRGSWYTITIRIFNLPFTVTLGETGVVCNSNNVENYHRLRGERPIIELSSGRESSKVLNKKKNLMGQAPTPIHLPWIMEKI